MADKTYQISLDDTPVADDFYADVVSLTVEEDVSKATQLSIQLATSLQSDGSWSHLDDEKLALFTPVNVRLGFTGSGGLAGALGALSDAFGAAAGGGDDGLEPVFNGYITSVNVNLASDQAAQPSTSPPSTAVS
jgi:hypothetical protein